MVVFFIFCFFSCMVVVGCKKIDTVDGMVGSKSMVYGGEQEHDVWWGARA